MTLQQLRLFLWLLATLLHAAPAVRAQDSDEEAETRGFSIYDTQAAKALAQSADEHLAAHRWSEAFVALQQLIEDHRGELLGATRPEVRGRRSQQFVHGGASHFATLRLFELDVEIQELYRDRYRGQAGRALRAAIDASDRRGLATVARLWPITDEAQRAWWALGDLEIELGNLDEGISAWGRGLGLALGRPWVSFGTVDDWKAALAELSPSEANPGGDATTPGLLRRIDLVLQLLGDGALPVAALLHEESGGGTALEPNVAFGTPPGESPDSWRAPFEFDLHPFDIPNTRPYNLFPARLDDAVFVSNTLELFSINAYTGELGWRSGEALNGWDQQSGQSRRQYFEGVDAREGLIAPAAAKGVVVAALQIPQAFQPKIDYGDMRIIVQIPNRRLFAFDARTGELLWDTRPPLMWDGESGTFADRMRVIGAPIIVGSRVLVPAARLRGRIEYHVGCFDLHTGEVLWSTPLITGQRELNMFGRKESEFSAPPLVVEGNRVLALTQLGTLAALDLFTGDTLWEVLYEQIPVQKSRSYRSGSFTPVWRNAPPVATGEMVVATPNDSRDMIGVHLESGALIWSVRHDLINRWARAEEAHVDLLVGADENLVYLAGTKVVALDCLRGVSRAEPGPSFKWAFPQGPRLTGSPPRPVLGEDRVYVPDSSMLSTIDRRTGRKLQESAWPSAGNLLLGDGMMFTLSSRRLTGYFEWEKLVERARRWTLAEPEEEERALDLAVLLEKRGVAEWQRGRTRDALPHLDEARAVLEDLMGSRGEEAHPRLRVEYHAVLRARARVLTDLARTAEALETLEEAHRIAPTREDLRDTLLEEQALLRGRENLARWLEVAERLLLECGRLPVSCITEGDGTESARLRPALGAEAEEVASTVDVPVALWVLIERSMAYARAGRSAEEFEDLHAILESWPHVDLGYGSAREWATGRIGEKVAAHDPGFEVFEQRARERYERAMAADNALLLGQIPELFPHSRAALAANDARLQWAIDAEDVVTVAAVALGELPEDWDPSTASEREVRHLLRMGELFGRLGNEQLRGGLARTLARTHPRISASVDGQAPRPLSEIAQEWSSPEPPPPASRDATFDASITPRLDEPGSFDPMGEIPAAPGAPARDLHVLLLADDDHLIALSDTAVDEPLWTKALGRETPRSWDQRFAATPARAHLATAERVLTLDRETGDTLWNWQGEADGVLAVSASDGVVVAIENLYPNEKQPREHRVVGLEASTGTELWRMVVDARLVPVAPLLCGDGRLVFLPRVEGSRGQVHDLFSGRRTGVFELEVYRELNARASWIEDGRLIVPRFQEATQPTRNNIIAIDLATGREDWRIDLSSGFASGRELTSIIASGVRTFLVLRPSDMLGSDRRGVIVELNPRIGSIGSSPIVELRDDDELIGLHPRQRHVVDEPYVFLLSSPRVGEELVVQAIHLPYGVRWQARLPFTDEGRYTNTMPAPALSQTTVAIGWREPQPGEHRGRPETRVRFLERQSGKHRDTRTLSDQLDNGRSIQFSALGDGLIICAGKGMDIWR